MAGRTDRQIALAMLEGGADALPRLLDELVSALRLREAAIRREGRALPGAEEALRALAGRRAAPSSRCSRATSRPTRP